VKLTDKRHETIGWL